MKQAQRSLTAGLLAIGIVWAVGCGGSSKVAKKDQKTKKVDFLAIEIQEQQRVNAEMKVISDSLLAVRVRSEDGLAALRAVTSKSDQEMADIEKELPPKRSGFSDYFKKLWPF